MKRYQVQTKPCEGAETGHYADISIYVEGVIILDNTGFVARCATWAPCNDAGSHLCPEHGLPQRAGHSEFIKCSRKLIIMKKGFLLKFLDQRAKSSEDYWYISFGSDREHSLWCEMQKYQKMLQAEEWKLDCIINTGMFTSKSNVHFFLLAEVLFIHLDFFGVSSGDNGCRDVCFLLNIMELDAIRLVFHKAPENYIWKTQRQCVSPEIKTSVCIYLWTRGF